MQVFWGDGPVDRRVDGPAMREFGEQQVARFGTARTCFVVLARASRPPSRQNPKCAGCRTSLGSLAINTASQSASPATPF
jgi:hypothetical protein